METSIQVLSAAEREQVHERTLTVLGKTGMRCDTAEGRRILAGAGAQVDESTHVVRFPAELVERSLAAATTTYTLGGRRPGWSYALNEGNFTLLADGGATAVFDAKTGERRPTCHDAFQYLRSPSGWISVPLTTCRVCAEMPAGDIMNHASGGGAPIYMGPSYMTTCACTWTTGGGAPFPMGPSMIIDLCICK